MRIIDRPKKFNVNDYTCHSDVYNNDEDLGLSIDGNEKFIHIRQYRVVDKTDDDWKTEEILNVFLTRDEFEQLEMMFRDFHWFHLGAIWNIQRRCIDPNSTHN